MDLEKYSFTFSQKKILSDIEKDLRMWSEPSLDDIFPHHLREKFEGKQLAKKLFEYFVNYHKSIQSKTKSYENFNFSYTPKRFEIETIHKKDLGLGSCPVASEATRCCNLLTLDAVESCGFDCSYCSIQSFYNQDKVVFDKNFKNKLLNLNLDKDKIYHIGTGQSSDSLMWGNREGVLDALFDFAKENQNVILEFKTKSNNIKYLLENYVPKNISVTWSLNPQTVIDNEEHLTASLDERIKSARALADKGVLVGFHFHPIIVYKNYLDEYKKIYDRLLSEFSPDEVVLISMGTLTFIKPVIKKLRERELKSKILQMPFSEINGKKSYDLKTKEEMFKHCYESLKPWHGKVYFYMCMEDHSLWKKVFGYEYASNNEMEDDMKKSYMAKIKNKK